MNDSKKNITGLSDLEVLESAKKYGTNSVEHQKKNHFLNSILDVVKEPMFLLLFTATSIYFITGDYGDGIFMAFAIVFVMAISVFQESRSRNAIEALKKLTQPQCKVIRNSQLIEIPTEEIVIGDCVQLEEGAFIPADGIILSSNDFSVNESILTGESLSVFKSNESENKHRDVIISPLTNYNVTVLDQRFNKNSSVTLINTNVTRDGSFRDANVTGVLFDLNTKKNTFNASGDMKMSSVYDVEKNYSGYNTSLYLAETAGKIRFSSGVNYISKEYDPNDLGINFQTNYTSWSNNVNYRILNPTKIFNTFRINLNSYFEYNNLSGRIQSNNFNVNFSSTNKKNHYFGGGIDYAPFKNYDYYEARQDGRFVIYPESYGSWVYFSSNYNYKFALDINPYFTNTSEKDRYDYGITIGPRYRFSDRLSIVYSFDIFKQINNLGFIDSDDSEIYLAKRNRETYTNSITSKYSINSNMNFNLSVRHYWSYAENNSIHTLNNDGTLTENNTYSENKNSNFSTWNLDLSYSWWFAPGSQLSVLYRNNANTFDRNINKNFGSNFSNLVSDNLNHILSVSLRYYIDYNQAKNWL